MTSVTSRSEGARRVDVGAARDVLLEDVVLDGAADALPGDALLLGEHEVEREQDRRRGVDRHRGRDAVERDAVEQPPHVGDRVDRHADPADLAARHRVVASRSRSGSAGRRRPRGRSCPGRGGSGSAGSTPSASEKPAYWRIVHSRRGTSSRIDAAREREVRRGRRPRRAVERRDVRRAVDGANAVSGRGRDAVAGAAGAGSVGLAQGPIVGAAGAAPRPLRGGLPEAPGGRWLGLARAGPQYLADNPLTEPALCRTFCTSENAQAFGQLGRVAGWACAEDLGGNAGRANRQA